MEDGANDQGKVYAEIERGKKVRAWLDEKDKEIEKLKSELAQARSWCDDNYRKLTEIINFLQRIKNRIGAFSGIEEEYNNLMEHLKQ